MLLFCKVFLSKLNNERFYNFPLSKTVLALILNQRLLISKFCEVLNIPNRLTNTFVMYTLPLSAQRKIRPL